MQANLSCPRGRVVPFHPTARRAAVIARGHSAQSRRQILQLGVALPLLSSGHAWADGVAAVEAPAAAPAAPLVPAAEAALLAPQPFLEVDFQLVPPAGWAFVDTQPAYDPNRRGPAPEPSPVRARFDSPDGTAVVSVLVRNAQAIKRSIVQVSDVSVFGDLEEAARLLLPQASTVLSASVLKVILPPKQTSIGAVELPPKNYYKYELVTPSGLHLVTTIAAQRGRVYVCGASTQAGAKWEQHGPALRASADSFRLRADGAVL